MQRGKGQVQGQRKRIEGGDRIICEFVERGGKGSLCVRCKTLTLFQFQYRQEREGSEIEKRV